MQFTISPKAITLEELYQEGIVPDFDEQRQCYYLQDPVTDEELTPCIMDQYEFEKYLTDHPEVVERMRALEQGDVEERLAA